MGNLLEIKNFQSLNYLEVPKPYIIHGVRRGCSIATAANMYKSEVQDDEERGHFAEVELISRGSLHVVSYLARRE